MKFTFDISTEEAKQAADYLDRQIDDFYDLASDFLDSLDMPIINLFERLTGMGSTEKAQEGLDIFLKFFTREDYKIKEILKVEQLEKEYNNATIERDKYLLELNALKEELQKVKKQNEFNKEELDRVTAEAKAGIELREGTIKRYKDQIRDHILSGDTLTKKVEEQGNIIAMLKKEGMTLATDGINQIKQLQEDYRTLENNFKKIGKDYKQLEQISNKYKAEVGTLKDEKRHLEERIKTLVEETEETLSNTKAQAATIDNLKGILKLTESQRDDYKLMVGEYRAEKNNLTGKMLASSNTCQQLEKEKKHLEARLKDKEERIKELENDVLQCLPPAPDSSDVANWFSGDNDDGTEFSNA